jgi:hypothetical protein
MNEFSEIRSQNPSAKWVLLLDFTFISVNFCQIRWKSSETSTYSSQWIESEVKIRRKHFLGIEIVNLIFEAIQKLNSSIH